MGGGTGTIEEEWGLLDSGKDKRTEAYVHDASENRARVVTWWLEKQDKTGRLSHERNGGLGQTNAPHDFRETERGAKVGEVIRWLLGARNARPSEGGGKEEGS